MGTYLYLKCAKKVILRSFNGYLFILRLYYNECHLLKINNVRYYGSQFPNVIGLNFNMHSNHSMALLSLSNSNNRLFNH